MFQGWRLKLREAEEALKQGRLEEAGRLLRAESLEQYLPGKRLMMRLVERYGQRACHRLCGGDERAAWQDLEVAEQIAGQTDQWSAARQNLIDVSLRQAESCLETDATGCIKRLEQLERRGIKTESVRVLKEVARRLDSARNLVRRGKFADAELQLNSAETLRPGLTMVERERDGCRDLIEQTRPLTENLHRAMADENWSDVVTIADQLLELAPEHRVAREARRRAWGEVGTRVVESRHLADTQAWNPASKPPGESGSPAVADGLPRSVLWIDAVGGFLLCLNDEIVIGQASPENVVDIPILGDVSRRHAVVRRQGEGYVIDPIQRVSLNERSIDGTTMLNDGDEIRLGGSVRLRFRKPHALSATARLDFVSRHRTQPTADGVLLMAESCVLGPKWQNHIVCRDWSGDVVLFRQDDALYCRAMDSIQIDGKLCDGRGRLSLNSRVTGDDFSMSLEPVV